MCISAEVNFAAAAVIGAVGIATLTHVRHPRAVLFAAMPLFFALHQFTEAFVWLGLEDRIGKLALSNAAFLFIFYAQALLPFLMSLAVLLLEEVPWRRRLLAGLTAIGLVFSGYMTWAIFSVPTEVFARAHSVVYSNSATESPVTAFFYILVTCGSLILSGHRVVRWFGVLNLVGLTVVAIVKAYAFSSVWCLYAAVLSVMLYWQFRTHKIRLPRPAPHPA